MDSREFLAMLDERLGDGRNYPTLDDYSKALSLIRAREAMNKADIRALTTVAEILDQRNAYNPDFHYVEPKPRIKTFDHPFMLQSSKDGVEWHLVGDNRFRTVDAAQSHARYLRQLGHIRIWDMNNEKFIRLY